MDDDKYFQFPIALLAYPGSWYDVVNVIVDWSIGDFMRSNECDFAAAQSSLNINGGSATGTRQRAQLGQTFINSAPSCSALLATVRMRTDWTFSSRNGEGLTERAYKILSAVYSSIGRNPMRRITVDDVQRRAAGCASRDLFDKWQKRGAVYTPKQIRRTLDDLHAGGYFARATWGRRQTFYSNRKKPDELWAMIEKQKAPVLQRKAAHALDWQRTQEIVQRITSGQLTRNKGETNGQL